MVSRGYPSRIKLMTKKVIFMPVTTERPYNTLTDNKEEIVEALYGVGQDDIADQVGAALSELKGLETQRVVEFNLSKDDTLFVMPQGKTFWSQDMARGMEEIIKENVSCKVIVFRQNVGFGKLGLAEK